jgi:hypothetical protein
MTAKAPRRMPRKARPAVPGEKWWMEMKTRGKGSNQR